MSTPNKPSSSKDSQPIQEYCIRFTPKTNKKYNVMRFNESDGIDFTKWKKVKLERDFNIKEFKAGEDDQPKFGAGSVFGAEQREENRKKRYQKYVSRYRPEDHPYILSVKLNKTQQQPTPITNTINNSTASSKQSSVRRFKGVREGGVTDNTSYYVFFQAHDGAFEAFPVSEWYKFTPIPKFKALTAEEAEEKFIKRDKMLNFFSVMDNKNKKETGDTMDDEFKPRRSRKDFKTSDMDDWNDYGNSDGSDSDAGDKKGKKKGKKKDSDDDFDSEAKEESDEGDFDTREVDYMSDLSSDEDEELAEKIAEQLKGVEDEDALRQLSLTDDEEEDENKQKEENEKKEDNKPQTNESPNKKLPTDIKIKQEKKDDSSDTSDSDFDDDYKLQSPIFMQKVEVKKEATAEQSAANNLKRKLADTSTDSINQSASNTSSLSSNNSNQVKRPKVSNQSPEVQLEEAVKRYLLRKPTSAIELIKNLRKMKIINSKEQLVQNISQILKKLNAQEKEISGKKYYYLDPKNFK